MSKKRLKTLRTNAFHAQSGRCYYCCRPMWLSSPDELGLRPRSARPYQCTAEHLVAQQDGGKDVADNIAAACRLCNLRRHKRLTSAPSAEVYLAKVRRRVAKGKWHPTGLLRAVSTSTFARTRL
ncbi:HNH endonuclease [Xanthomonas campestris pv. campestris]|uniref:HNH endonuclease n=2 Tax=Xanthomonas campestris TaxID=339 RepID=UPI002AD28A19|nr:HNH endonuclease [Xanthomonas campestris]MEB1348208.1 HNH endonuclease [Xanthomonas campestris pv. campestris]